MASIDQFLPTADVALRVKAITGSTNDSASAAGIAAWVKSVTGSAPDVIDLGGGKAKVVLTKNQHRTMRKWLDSQVGKAFAPEDHDKRLYIEMGPTFTPWALKYAIPIGAALFIVGWGARSMFK